MESRRHLNVRGKSATLPAITEKDWLDLKFGVEAGVDAFALSFVKVSAFIARSSHQHRKLRTTVRRARCTARCGCDM
jgi:pyruvate kinase